MQTTLIMLMVVFCVLAVYALYRHIQLSRSRNLLNPRARRHPR
ncbi:MULTISPECIES: hypothetical protein [Yersiniaceae]|nr:MULTISPECIES: hypothetical protein [Yersiniaceae]MDV5141265.1 hypothetical protein [Chimaeribacter arupi]WKZ91103.1 hypothetical protein P0E69_12715 [Chimaeribacter arupi]